MQDAVDVNEAPIRPKVVCAGEGVWRKRRVNLLLHKERTTEMSSAARFNTGFPQVTCLGG